MFGGVCNPDTSFGCRKCGDTFFPECMSDGHPGYCEECGATLDAAIHAEKCADFRYVSKDWFQRKDFMTPLHVLADRDTADYLAQLKKSA